MTWKQRKATSRKRSQVRKAGREKKRGGGLASAAAYKASRPLRLVKA